MADPVVLVDAYVAWSTGTGSAVYTELSGVKSLTLPISRDDLDDAVMGDQIGAKYPGRLDIPIDVVCRQDFATAVTGVDKQAYNRLINRTAFRLKIRPVDAAASGPNPSIILNKVRLHAMTPIDGKHGDALENKLKFLPQSGCTLARSTAT